MVVAKAHTFDDAIEPMQNFAEGRPVETCEG